MTAATIAFDPRELEATVKAANTPEEEFHFEMPRPPGLGVGWVSILKEAEVKAVLGIPDPVRLVAYLCVGKVESFFATPELEQRGWRAHTPLSDLVFEDCWGAKKAAKALLRSGLCRGLVIDGDTALKLAQLT